MIQDEDELWSIVDFAIREAKYPHRYTIDVLCEQTPDGNVYQADTSFSLNKSRPLPHAPTTPILYFQLHTATREICKAEIELAGLAGQGYEKTMLQIADVIARELHARSITVTKTDIPINHLEEAGYRDFIKPYATRD